MMRDINDILREDGEAVARTFRDSATRFEPPSAKAKSTVSSVSLDDFHAYMPKHAYIYRPSREMWPGSSVNSRIEPVLEVDPDGKPVLDDKGRQKHSSAATWLDQNRPVEQMTWAPGEPELIRGRLISDGGWIEKEGVACYNLYRPSLIKQGNVAEAGRWCGHVQKVFGDDADHIIKWIAHRVQRPQEKINHALVLGGTQGIGKDTLLEPVKRAVGPWNFKEVSPQQTYRSTIPTILPVGPQRCSSISRDRGPPPEPWHQRQILRHSSSFYGASRRRSNAEGGTARGGVAMRI
jgi:hypothetical protein